MPTELTPPLPPATGTITLTNGSATVSGTGTGLKLLRVGDALLTANGSVVVVDVKPTANDSATITKAFSGATETNVAYTIVPRALNAQAAAYFELLSVALTAQEGRFVWLWNPATAAGDPGTGKIQANHATWTSATALYLSDTDQQSNGLGTWLATWGASKVVLTSLDRPSVFAFATLGTVTDSTGYRTITLSALIGAPDFNADERIVVALLPAGATGPQGVGPGITLTFDDPTADADPGAGRFRLNNATHASATAAYIDDAAANGAAITTWLDALDDSTATIKGQLTIVDKADAAVFRIYNVTGTVVNGTGYRKVTIAYVTGAGTLADETPCSLTFSRTGNNGTNGISFIWRGAYSGATAYAANDAVSDQSSTWVALQATTGNAPPSLPTTSNAYWELMAKAGADGAGTGDVTAAANIADGALVVGDGGAKGVKAHPTLTLPAGTDTLVGKVTTDTLTNKTLTTPTMTGPIVTTSRLDLQVGQIKFPAAQNASADANTLDDYEEGTWTPGMSFGGSATGITYTTQIGSYTKIGNRVFVDWQIILSSNGTGSGAALTTGLPFTVSATTAPIVVGEVSGFSSLTAGLGGYFRQTETNITLRAPNTTGAASVTEANVSDTANFVGAGQYTV